MNDKRMPLGKRRIKRERRERLENEKSCPLGAMAHEGGLGSCLDDVRLGRTRYVHSLTKQSKAYLKGVLRSYVTTSRGGTSG
jgi:hypothetical protein